VGATTSAFMILVGLGVEAAVIEAMALAASQSQGGCLYLFRIQLAGEL